MGALAVHLLSVAASTPMASAAERWPGVDETVVERVAAAAGRTPWIPPFAPEGDLRLFCFLVAGLVGGFALGYAYRALFHERQASEQAAPLIASPQRVGRRAVSERGACGGAAVDELAERSEAFSMSGKES